MSDTAITTLASAAVAITTTIVGFLTLWVRLKYNDRKIEETKTQVETVGRKIDENTEVTKEGTKAAAVHAKVAADTAADAKQAVRTVGENLSKRLNGELSAAIESAVKPVRDALQDHVLQDEQNMNEIRTSLAEIHRKIQ